MPIRRFVFLLPLLAASIVPAQVVAPNSMGVSMGHLHLNSADVEAQRKFWVDLLGARPAKLGPADVYAIPGVLVMVAKKPETPAGTDGSVVNHLGLKVKDFEGLRARVKAAGFAFTSPSETQIIITGPEGVRVELTKDAEMSTPVAHHHVHFATPDVTAMQKWYADTFGAIPGKRGKFDAADLPGVNLSFTKTDSRMAGTKGRVLDHIGFEVHDLEAFIHRLESNGIKMDMPYRKIPTLGIAIAFFTDPWGTYIELTEGLNQVH
jgi:catechol 2,3-dioxygenase-like lactoylglutathione lyase family enzyme